MINCEDKDALAFQSNTLLLKTGMRESSGNQKVLKSPIVRKW